MRGYVRKGHILPGDPKLLELSRKLLKIELQNDPVDEKRLSALRSELKKFPGLSTDDYDSLVISDTSSNHAYNPIGESIRILFKNGAVKDLSNASDLLNISALRQPVTKYYLCYPRELAQQV
jgi:hypothetical protein